MEKVMDRKACYGILDKVFPMGPKGLREIVTECFQCSERVPCLKAALSTREGIEMRAEVLNRHAAGGLIGRLNRWSQKKELSRLMKKAGEKRK
jgi:hypothetical protein